MSWLNLTTDICALLTGAGIRFCILRMPKESLEAEHPGDIDLLVQPEDIELLYDTLNQVYELRPLSFIQTHAQLPLLDRTTGQSLKLDLHTYLFAGMSGGFFRIPLEQGVLARRHTKNALPRPALEDELTLLMLHTLLDKQQIIAAYLPRLASMIAKLKPRQSNILTDWSALWPYSLAEQIWQGLELTDRKLLARSRRRLQIYLWRQSPLRSTRQITGAQIRARAYLQFWPLDRPFTVALLGPDGAGKTTIAKNLTQHGLATYTYMGGRGEFLPTTRLIHALSHRRKSSPTSPTSPKPNFSPPTTRRNWLNSLKNNTSRPLIHLHQIAEYGARYLSAVSASGAPVAIFDRYVFDHLLPHAKSTRKDWAAHITSTVYRDLFPSPDLVIFLTAPTSTLRQRKDEQSTQELEKKKQGYRQLFQVALANSPTKLVEVATSTDLKTTTDAVRTSIEKARLERLRSLP